VSVATLLNTTVTLSAPVVTNDEMGGEVRTYSVKSTFRARVLEHKRSREFEQVGRRSEVAQAQVLCASDPGAQLGDVITDIANGRQYAVDNVIDEASQGEIFSIYCTRMFPES
jgi:head-tail adaptor